MAMAASSSISKLLSSLLPSKSAPPPPPSSPSPLPTHLSLLPRVPLSKTPSGWAPLMATTWVPSTSSSSLANVLCPSLAYSSVLFFRSDFNVQIIVQENEPEDKLVVRFRREVLKAGVLQECKRRRFFENKKEKEKRKARQAARKNRKRYPQSKDPKQAIQEASKNKKDYDDQDDKWDYYEVDLPYH